MYNKQQVHLGDKSQVNKEINQLSLSSQVHQQVAANLLEDPSIYDYDGFVTKKNKEQKTNIVQQKQSEKKEQKQSQYIGTIIEQAKRREQEKLVIQSRMNAKEALKTGKEIYISESFKKQHEQIKKFEKIEQLQEKIYEDKRKNNNHGIYKSMYDNNEFKNNSVGQKQDQKDSFKIIEKILDQQDETLKEKEKQKNQQKLEAQEIQINEQNIIGDLKNESELKSKSRSKSRSRSKEKENNQIIQQQTREQKLNSYKERYLQRKQL